MPRAPSEASGDLLGRGPAHPDRSIDLRRRSSCPLALARLEEDPLIEGDFYPGDLLENVLRLDESFWRLHPKEHLRTREVAERALEVLHERSELDSAGVADTELIASVRTFLTR